MEGVVKEEALAEGEEGEDGRETEEPARNASRSDAGGEEKKKAKEIMIFQKTPGYFKPGVFLRIGI